MSREKTDAILFIHGYNVTFKEAIATSVKIGKNNQDVNGNKGVNVISFSWPSDGSMFPWIAYSNDRLDAAASGPAFARGLLKMADFFRNMSPEEACHQKLHLMAHSMGNYVLRHALQEVRRQNGGRIPRPGQRLRVDPGRGEGVVELEAREVSRAGKGAFGAVAQTVDVQASADSETGRAGQ